MVMFRIVLGYMPKSRISGSYGISMFSFLSCSPQMLYQLTLLPTVQEGSLFATPPPAFVICRHINDGHSDWCEAKLPLKKTHESTSSLQQHSQ